MPACIAALLTPPLAPSTPIPSRSGDCKPDSKDDSGCTPRQPQWRNAAVVLDALSGGKLDTQLYGCTTPKGDISINTTGGF